MATGEDLKNAIKGKGFTITSAAKLLGISRQTLTSYINKAEIDDDISKSVRAKLDISLSKNQIDVVSQLVGVIVSQQETIKILAGKVKPYMNDPPHISEIRKEG